MFVGKKEYNERLECCGKCDKFIKATKQCGVCNCIMPVKALLKYTPSGDVECPHPEGNKWLKHEENTSTNSSSTGS